MNKKKLPKAIQQLPEGMRETDASIKASEPPGAGEMTHWLDEKQPGPAHTVSASVGLELPSRPPDAPLREASLPEAPPTAQAVTRLDNNLQSRRRRAEGIVERHANYSALGGIIPLPVLNVGAVTTIIVRMVKALSRVYGVPFEQDRARAIVLGLIGGLTPAAAATMTASTLLYLIPGSNLVGLAVSSVTASTCTRKIGWIVVDHFENGATLADFRLPHAANRH